MQRPYTPIVATLGYILSPDATRVLLVHRNRRPDDAHFGKYNGLGGKMEAGEDIVTCLRRELEEEAAIRCTAVRLRGTVNWPGFGPSGEDWLGFIFVVDRFTGTPRTENEEGTLEWVPLAELAQLPMWEGDRYFLPLVFDDDPRVFHGVLPYCNGKPQSWSHVRV